jgi:pimeloyl-ACP methyl ester carboxylesterase
MTHLQQVSIVKAFDVPELAASLAYHDIPGSGAPIIFIHGLGCAGSCDYPAVASQPSLAGRRMILVDLLGSGFSDRPENFDYTIESHAGIVAKLISEICPEPIDLFGHSMGGAIAIATAARLGSRVRRIALGEPNLDPGGGTFSSQIASMSEGVYVLSGHDETANIARADGYQIWANSLARSAAFAVHREATSLVAGCEPSWREMLYRMAMRKTVIFGARSLPSADIDRLSCHGCAVEIVADAGHSMALENPAGLAAALHNAFR